MAGIGLNILFNRKNHMHADVAVAAKPNLIEKVNLRSQLGKNFLFRSFMRIRCLHEDDCNIAKLDRIRESYLRSAELREKLGTPKPSLEKRIARVDEALVVQHSNATKRIVDSYLQDKNENCGSLKEAAMHLQKAEEHSTASTKASVLELRQESATKVILLGMGHLVFAMGGGQASGGQKAHMEAAINIFRNAIPIDPRWEIKISLHFEDLEKRRENGATVCEKLREELNLQPASHQP